MDLSQHLTLMVNDFGHLAGGINFPHKLARIKGTQVSAILCTESLLPLQTEHYNPMLTDEILDSCNVITENRKQKAEAISPAFLMSVNDHKY